jgi:acyl carrier protein
MNIKNEIIRCAENAGIVLDSKASAEEVDLREYISDSLEFISFIVELENELGIEIPTEMLLFDNLASISSFSYMLKNLIDDGSPHENSASENEI